MVYDKYLYSQSYGFSSSHVWMRELDYKESWVPKNWCFWTVVGEDSWESLGVQGDPTSPSWRRLVLNVHWKDWCWSWNSNILATSWEELTHWKRPWCWEILKAGGEGDDRGWDGWMASLTQWTWVWVNSESWWWSGKPGVLKPMGSQKVGHDWATELTDWLCLRRPCSSAFVIMILLRVNSTPSSRVQSAIWAIPKIANTLPRWNVRAEKPGTKVQMAQVLFFHWL